MLKMKKKKKVIRKIALFHSAPSSSTTRRIKENEEMEGEVEGGMSISETTWLVPYDRYNQIEITLRCRLTGWSNWLSLDGDGKVFKLHQNVTFGQEILSTTKKIKITQRPRKEHKRRRRGRGLRGGRRRIVVNKWLAVAVILVRRNDRPQSGRIG